MAEWMMKLEIVVTIFCPFSNRLPKLTNFRRKIVATVAFFFQKVFFGSWKKVEVKWDTFWGLHGTRRGSEHQAPVCF